MASFAKLNSRNEVVEVLSVHNNELLDNGIESEQKGIEFLTKLFKHTNWKQTSYNANFRKRHAGIGYTYDEIRDAFIPPKPFNSWLFNESNLDWKAPSPKPVDENDYFWNEEILAWERLKLKNEGNQ
jgi:hypothetical protein